MKTPLRPVVLVALLHLLLISLVPTQKAHAQDPNCVFVVPAQTASVSRAGSTSSFIVTTQDSCSWSASSSASWLTVTGSGLGSGTITFNAGVNTGPARSAIITVGNTQRRVEQASGCAVALTPSGASFGNQGGPGSFSVSTAPGCAWSTRTSANFVTQLTASGVGPGTVSYRVGPSMALRSAQIVVSSSTNELSNTFTITQAIGCSYSLSAASASVAASSGEGTFELVADQGCPSTVTSHATWLSATPRDGTGSRTIKFRVDANVGPARAATLHVAGLTFTVVQSSGCSASISPNPSSASALGGPLHVTLQLSSDACTWSAGSAATWLANSTPFGSGSSDIDLSVASNAGPARTAVLIASGPSYSVSANVEQASGCTLSLPTDSASVALAGGTGSFQVVHASGCSYSVESDAPWLTAAVVNGAVSYQALAADSAAREGHITLKSSSTSSSARFTVRQDGACSLGLPSSGATLSASAQSSTFAVATTGDCSWTASSDQSWISNVQRTAGGVSFSVAANTGLARIGLIRLQNTANGAISYVVTQSSGCEVGAASSSLSSAAQGGAQSFPITLGAGCAAQVSASDSWLQNVSLAEHTVRFDVANNAGPARTGTLKVSAGSSEVAVSVQQAAGCNLALEITGQSFAESGGSGTFELLTAPGCTFTTKSSAAWLTARNSDGFVQFDVAVNIAEARTALIDVQSTQNSAHATFTVDQLGGLVAPTILRQPGPVIVREGEPFELSVIASGGALSYTWRKDSTPLADAHGSSFGSPKAKLTDSGNYDVLISNEAGVIASIVASVTVQPRTTSSVDPALDGDAGLAEDAGPTRHRHKGCAVGTSGTSNLSVLWLLPLLALLHRRLRRAES